MKPADFRNAAWAEVQTHISETLSLVHEAWRRHGPGTTREVASRAGISLFTFRPRTTELYKFGLLELAPGQSKRTADGGIYEFRSRAEAADSGAWRDRADFRDSRDESNVQRVGFITVDEAVNSLPEVERAALGARLMSEYGHHRKKRRPADGQLSLLSAS